MRAVNLMPRDERRARLDVGRLPLLAVAGAVVALTAGAFVLSRSAAGSAEDTRAEAQALEAQIAQLPTAPDSEVSVGMLALERSNRVAALAAALSSRTAFDRVLRDVSLVFPGDAWLTQLEVAAPVADPAAVPPAAGVPGQAAAAGGVTIKGATFTHDSVATVLGRLSVVPTLTDVRLVSTALVVPQEESESEGATAQRPQKPFVTFDITASVKTGTTS